MKIWGQVKIFDKPHWVSCRTLHATSLLSCYKMEIKINRNANKKENIYGIVLEEREIFANFATNKILFVVK